MEKIIREIMSTVFKIELKTINHNTSVNNVESWDSLNHINMISALEEEFQIRFNDDQIINMVNYQEIVSVLEEEYKKQINE